MKKINKLQLRAEIISQINTLKVCDLYATNGNKAIDLIKSFDNKQNTIDILLKELKASDGDRTQIIAYFILELTNLEEVQDTLWDYIKDTDVNDYIKEVSCSILRAHGGKITIEELSEYLNNPEEIIDAETKKLLEDSFKNPEAQIDFLDFLFALNEEEQILLLDSLKDDYPQNYVANILIPAIETNPTCNVKNLIIDMLGETKSEIAVPSLKDIIEYSNDENIKKKANKSLNLLKLSGIDITKDYQNITKSLCIESTNPYKTFTTSIDGVGNQGFIISRLRNDNTIQMFSIVINDLQGIMDCFGFNQITQGEFDRIIKRFEANNKQIEPSFEYAKYKIIEAEKTNKTKNYPLPYEYVAWKELVSDINNLSETPETLVAKWGNEIVYPDYTMVENNELCQNWFLEEEDSEIIDNIIHEFKMVLSKNIVEYKKDMGLTETKINKLAQEKLYEIFDKKTLAIFIKRLEDTAFILDILGEINLRNITGSLIIELKKGMDIKGIELFKDIIKRSLYESLLREKDILTQEEKTATIFDAHSTKSKYDFKLEDIEFITDKLYEKWCK